MNHGALPDVLHAALLSLAEATGIALLVDRFAAEGRVRLGGEAWSLQLERAGEDALLLALERPAGDIETALRVLAAAHWRAPPLAGWPPGTQLGLRGPHHAGRWVVAQRLDAAALRVQGLPERVARLQDALLLLDQAAPLGAAPGAGAGSPLAGAFAGAFGAGFARASGGPFTR